MVGLLIVTGLIAIAVVALFASALRRSPIPPAPGAGTDHPIQGPTQHRSGGAHLADAHPHEPPERPDRGRTALSLKARLAFVHSPQPDAVVLDCTLQELDGDRDGAVPVGAPFTLQLRLPETAWFATSLELLLEQWAEDSRLVEISLLARDGHAKAHVGDGSSRLMLEVDSAAGLSVG